MDGERIGLCLEERVRRREKDLTPAEQRERANHPYRWYGKQYEYLPTGVLSLRILDAPYGSRCQWRDGKRQRLEDCLGRVVQVLTALAQVRKSQRAEREARERAWAEAQRRREELRREIEAEEKRVAALMAEAEAWETSERLRRYVAAVRSENQAAGAAIAPDSELGQWLSWAEQQADRLDPTVESPPSILDRKREMSAYW